jgi:hypothetical protein
MKDIKNIKKIKHIIIAGTISLLLSPSASAELKDEACRGANLSLGGSTDCTKGGPQGSLNKLIAAIVNVLSVIVGIVAVIMIIWGGFNFITSGGDSGKVGTARSTIIYALIGLIIVALSQFIVRFVLSKLS